jgi:site-specific recombinase XerD
MKGCRPLTDDEVQVLGKAFGGTFALRTKALFMAGHRTDVRISELLSLRVSDVLPHGRIVDAITVERKHMQKKTEGSTGTPAP